jgi:oligopeptide transport system substrate-binding protein
MKDLCANKKFPCSGRPLCLPWVATDGHPYNKIIFGIFAPIKFIYSVSSFPRRQESTQMLGWNNTGLICILFALIFCLVGCERKTLVELGNQQQILHLINPSDPADIDPQITTGSVEHRIELTLFEPLLTKNLTTLEIEPAVADRWHVSEDGLVYEFHIRDNAKWSNGDKLVAMDFVLSWKRILSANLASEWATYLYVIKNAEEFHTGKIDDFSQVGVEALSDNILRVTLKSPTPYFLQLLDHNCMYPVHINTILKYGKFDERSTPWTKIENFVGNGPFVPVEWTPLKVFRVKKNENYWDKDNIHLNEVHMYPTESSQVAERMYLAGQTHVIEKLHPQRIARYQGTKDLRSFTMYGTYFYRFNTKIKPLDDVRVRQALAYSIDREIIVKQIRKGSEKVARFLVPPTPQYPEHFQFPQDIELAKKLLTEAGYPDGKNFPEFTLIFNTLDEHQQIATAIQQMWKKNLGINIKIENQEWKVFLDNQHHMNYQISRASWIGDYVDPNTFLEIFISNSGNNETGWANPEYDNLIRRASATVDPLERVKTLQEAEKIIMTELPIMPIYLYSWNRLVSPSVKNWHDNIQDYMSLKHVYLESEKKQ